VSGDVQVLGSPLPSESARALRRVALVDIVAGEAAFGDRTVGEVLEERIELGQPWYRFTSVSKQSARWVDAIRVALATDDGAASTQQPELRDSTQMSSLDFRSRAAVLVAAGLAERPGVLVVELGDETGAGFPEPALLETISALTPSLTTLVFTGGALRIPSTGDRGIHNVVLSDEREIHTHRKAVLR
jgi:RND superfamily putative drug exporter